MIALIQRVTEASVTIDGHITAAIQTGMLALIGVERTDTHKSVHQLSHRLLHYRLFSDAEGKMNLDVEASGGEVLLVPQFTLAADTHKGRRPGFSRAATPTQAAELFDLFVNKVDESGVKLKTGTFGADMKVALVNDGPVTFWLQTPPAE